MGRPKGSKNKLKEDIQKIADETVDSTISIPHKVVTTSTEIVPRGKVCTYCSHGKEVHYGPRIAWCNTSNCRCPEWVE